MHSSASRATDGTSSANSASVDEKRRPRCEVRYDPSASAESSGTVIMCAVPNRIVLCYRYRRCGRCDGHHNRRAKVAELTMIFFPSTALKPLFKRRVCNGVAATDTFDQLQPAR